MALPINVKKLIDNRVVESTRIEYKADWDPEPIIHSITDLPMISTTPAADILLLESPKKTVCQRYLLQD